MYPYYGDGIALAMDGGDTAAKEESAPASDADGAASTKEDSFGTNNQVSARRINTFVLLLFCRTYYLAHYTVILPCRSTVLMRPML